jgi:KipI family sensor histidine kinase inhibitor
MRLLPSGDTALLVELDDLEAVLAWYATLTEERPDGVIDIVPAARTVLVVIDPERTDLGTLEGGLRSVRPRHERVTSEDLVEIPVSYDGKDLADVGSLLDCAPQEVVRRHTAEEWTVAFCGFAPGFGYMTGESRWDIPRRHDPRTNVPAGSVGLAGEFSGVYPRASPGGWQLIGHTDLAVFDLQREPPALLRPGTRVRFTDVGKT